MAKIKDNVVDITPRGEIANILKIVATGKGLNTERKNALLKLKEFLVKNNYKIFQSDFRTFGLATIGSSAVFQVLKGQRGHLAAFPDNLVLVICIDYADKWPGYANRKFAAPPITSKGELVETVG
tara:strand:+ start:129 stop:503 length:375 start_codon:yes stop_codon:yes gene_type:complete